MSSFSKVLITGATGQLGKALSMLFPHHFAQVHALHRNQFDLTRPEQMKSVLQALKPDLIINAAAYTAVDKAEDEPEMAKVINADAMEHLSRYAQENNAVIIHISTDYVFGGSGNLPFKPDDPVNCQNIYAQTKWQGEEILRTNHHAHVIIRISWLYGSTGHNFLNTMLRLSASHPQIKVVYDQVGTPTYVNDLADAILQISLQLQTADHRFGTYHFSNHGVASWFDFATAIFEISGLTTKVLPVLSHEFPTRALRPAYSVLDKTAIEKQFRIQIPHWRTSLKACLLSIQQNHV